MKQILNFLEKNSYSYQVANLENIEAKKTPVSIWEVLPQNKEELIDIVTEMGRHGIPYSVVSTGCNWGLGARWTENCFLLNLSCLDKIRWDENFGVVRLEPGVTQQKLADYLESIHSQYFLDVTGSSSYSSVVGNAIERGIAYNSQRVSHVISMEVLLPTGDLISSGVSSRKEDDINYLYPYGLGPDWRGIFFQSNLGVITEMSLQLHKKPQYTASIQFSVDSEDALMELLPPLKRLIAEGVIAGIPHIANPERLSTSVEPHIMDCLQAQGISYTRSDIKRVLEKIGMNRAWVGVCSVSGSKKEVKIKVKEWKKLLGKKTRMRVTYPWQFHLLDRFHNLLKRFFFFQVLGAIRAFHNFNFGKPSNVAIHSVVGRRVDTSSLEKIRQEFSQSESAFMYYLPVMPFSGKHLSEVLKEAKLLKDQGFSSAMTINPISHRVLEVVLSIQYQRERAEEAHRCLSSSRESLASFGIYPYRVAAYEPCRKEKTREFLSWMKKLVEHNDKERENSNDRVEARA